MEHWAYRTDDDEPPEKETTLYARACDKAAPAAIGAAERRQQQWGLDDAVRRHECARRSVVVGVRPGPGKRATTAE